MEQCNINDQHNQRKYTQKYNEFSCSVDFYVVKFKWIVMFFQLIHFHTLR